MALSKRARGQIEQTIGGILDAQDCDTLIVRGKDCDVLYKNASASARLQAEQKNPLSCKRGYTQIFPGLCDRCPSAGADVKLPAVFDVTDANGRIFSASCNEITWIDDKAATVFFLRDVHDERTANQRLYNLAYIDFLTGVPNRQKLRADFESIHTGIENVEIEGVLAIFDLDNFKAINDTYGHNTGDVMLRRLTEHLEGDPSFKGHLYRLGGDEFVLLYSERVGRFYSHDERKQHYGELLAGALRSYTMPNIEASCTISMGVAFFPEHGDNFSELLRKADIALYKAKAAGRNQYVFFEDQYDTAKKFKDLYINIRPILDERGQTFGYELIDHGSSEEEQEGEQTLTEYGGEFNRTMDALNLGDMSNKTCYFTPYSNQLLNAAVLNNLPKDKFVIEVQVADGWSEKELDKYRALRAFGYSIALAGMRSDQVIPALLRLADYCKFDSKYRDDYRQQQVISEYSDVAFIATGVDSHEDFERAKKIGFRYFQGYFFNEPVVTQKTKELDPMKVNLFRLLKMTSTDDFVDFKAISDIISQDVTLSYKLLKILNSAAVGLRNVTSITMAVTYLGEDNLKKWIALLALRGVADGTPLELVRMSLIRAQFGELLAPHFPIQLDPNQVFLTGMLSLLHIALEKTQEELLEEIAVSDDIRASLLTKTGPYSHLLTFFRHYEYANWDEVARFADDNRLSSQLINDSYIAAVKWYNDLIDD